MTSGALFGAHAGGGGASGGNKHLVEFRAGRMTLKGRTVHPDRRKGFLYVYQGEDSLMHFCWKDRATGEVEDDLLIFPDDCEFVRVDECTTGRVYVLKFKSFTRKYFFWMQEPKTDKDDEYCRRINEVLNNPPAGNSRSGGGGGSGPDGELQNLLNNMSQQQLMQLFGGVGQIGGLSSLLGTVGNSGSSGGSRPSTVGSSRGSSVTRSDGAPRTPVRARDAPAPAPAATPPNTATVTNPPRAGQAIILSDLQRYFSGMGNAPPSESDTPRTNIDLAAALASPDIVATAEDPASVERLTEHLPTPPEGQTQDTVRTTLLSPQFAQAVSQFSSALSTGQLGPLVSQFGLGGEAVSAANSGDLQQLFKALEGQSQGTTGGDTDKPKEGEEAKTKDDKLKDDKKKEDKQKDDDEGMSLD